MIKATASRLLLGLLLSTLVHGAGAAVYRWVDAEGNVVFSDTPQEGAELIELGEPTIVPHEKIAPAPEEPTSAALQELPYQEVTIASPSNDATLRDQQAVDVSVATAPPLQTEFGHKVQLYFDGAAYGAPSESTQFILQNVDRGTHSLAVAVLGISGRELARSADSVFHLHKTSIIKPKPRPKPAN